MPREFNRTQRVAHQAQRVLGQVLRQEVRDPRLGFVTITDVEVTRDLSRAKVFFSLLDPAAKLEATSRALRSAAGFLRSRLGEEMRLRTVPQLEFVYDESSERAARMDALLRELDDGAARRDGAAAEDGAGAGSDADDQDDEAAGPGR